MQNEANLPGSPRLKQSQSRGTANRAERTQFPASRDTRPSSPMRIVRNKPNSGNGKEKGKCFAGKELWLIVHQTDLGKTKPISPDGTRPVGSPAELPLGHEAPNEPNLRPMGRQDAVQTKPIRLRIVPNEPNSRECGADRIAKSAKRSQTWAGWGIWGTARERSLLCETKPIRGTRPGGRGVEGVGSSTGGSCEARFVRSEHRVYAGRTGLFRLKAVLRTGAAGIAEKPDAGWGGLW